MTIYRIHIDTEAKQTRTSCVDPIMVQVDMGGGVNPLPKFFKTIGQLNYYLKTRVGDLK